MLHSEMLESWKLWHPMKRNVMLQPFEYESRIMSVIWCHIYMAAYSGNKVVLNQRPKSLQVFALIYWWTDLQHRETITCSVWKHAESWCPMLHGLLSKTQYDIFLKMHVKGHTSGSCSTYIIAANHFPYTLLGFWMLSRQLSYLIFSGTIW